MQQKNLLLAFVLSAVILLGWTVLSRHLWPPPEPKPASTKVADNTSDKPGDDDKKVEEQGKEKKPTEKKPDSPKNLKAIERIVNADLEQLPITPEKDLVRLGARQKDSRFHLGVVLDPRGAGVRSVTLNKYQAADAYGRPVWMGENKKDRVPLDLLPVGANVTSPSFQLYAFNVHAPNEDQPLDTLGRLNWKVVEKTSDEQDGRQRESVSFQAETQGVIVTKTYTLTEGEYHLGLAVKMRRKDASNKPLTFRYQMTGAHGLPIEGRWYTSIFRNALIALVDNNGGVTRDLQDLRQISNWGGGNEVRRDPSRSLVFAGVANQFFASVIAVDNEQENRGFLRLARPTLETTLTKGTVVDVSENGASFVLKPQSNEPERTFHLPKGGLAPPKGAPLAVLHHTASALDRSGDYPEIVTNFFPMDSKPALWVEDITVRVASEAVELKGDTEVVHKYLLYNGPVKVSQLFPPLGIGNRSLEEGGVQPELYERYQEKLHLNTLTDYHSPGAVGRFANAIYWTDLVIKCTNLMHTVLGYLRAIIPSYGLCIIVLTFLVRGMMFPLSRKQALMSVRMQHLQPELKKLQEKYKDDRQGLGLAQMELYRKYGVNPLGSCWVLLLQMPIFMGLYFALQESTHFRLAPFWPWITNLAAPDMLIDWGEHVWFISRFEDYGSFLYLGPYFNLLPVIAVVLMIAQQKLMTPPPADEQQAMQQKMMKYMMIVFGLFFYKVAAGLCLYFITSSIWGFCERKLLPKKTAAPLEPVQPTGESYLQKLLRRTQGENVTPAPATGVVARNGGIAETADLRGRSGGKRGRNKNRPGAANEDADEADDTSMLGRWRRKVRDWWVAVLKEAEKKNRS